MILDVDIGNTRIKWLLRASTGSIVDRAAAGYRMESAVEAAFVHVENVARVRLSSVVGNVTNEFIAMARRRWGVQPEVATVIDGAGDVVCGYDVPEKLGIDRWLAVVAAWNRVKQPLMVIDAGSALTLDIVDAGGYHRGGYIIPGREMMKKTLGSDTWGVKVEQVGAWDIAPGTNTDAAVTNGCTLAAVGALERAWRDTGISNIVITGGDGPDLRRSLQTKARVIEVPDLVLEGLSLVLP